MVLDLPDQSAQAGEHLAECHAQCIVLGADHDVAGQVAACDRLGSVGQLRLVAEKFVEALNDAVGLDLGFRFDRCLRFL